MLTASLACKGRITLPKDVRQQLRVHTGDTVEFLIGADGEIRVRAGSVDVSALRSPLHRPGRRAVSAERMDEVIRRAARRS
jgi:AbrB family looped-hinge helix DNA binding protein